MLYIVVLPSIVSIALLLASLAMFWHLIVSKVENQKWLFYLLFTGKFIQVITASIAGVATDIKRIGDVACWTGYVGFWLTLGLIFFEFMVLVYLFFIRENVFKNRSNVMMFGIAWLLCCGFSIQLFLRSMLLCTV